MFNIVCRLWGRILHIWIQQQLQIFFLFHYLFSSKKAVLQGKTWKSFFYIFQTYFWILSFSIFISMGFISASSSKFCWPRMLIKSIVVILSFLFPPIFISWKLCIFWSVGSIFCPLTFVDWTNNSLFSVNFFRKIFFWFVVEIILDLFSFFS